MAVQVVLIYIQGFNRKGRKWNNGDKYYFISTVVLLVLLFLKVPVFISILSGSMAYFYLTGGPFTKILGQRVLAGVESIPRWRFRFLSCRCVYELFR
ncbi:MAG: hypothetical protein ACLTW9_08910 [Enterocloster sp.]